MSGLTGVLSGLTSLFVRKLLILTNLGIQSSLLVLVDDPAGAVTTALQGEVNCFWLPKPEIPWILSQAEIKAESKR